MRCLYTMGSEMKRKESESEQGTDLVFLVMALCLGESMAGECGWGGQSNMRESNGVCIRELIAME
jgi:hypothetical protein